MVKNLKKAKLKRCEIKMGPGRLLTMKLQWQATIMFCDLVIIIKNFNSTNSWRPWPPILVLHFFSMAILDSWPLLFTPGGVLVGIEFSWYGDTPMFSTKLHTTYICDWIGENPPLTHTMTRHTFHCQSIALSIS